MLSELQRLGTITAVANELHLSAPAVSMQLTALEREVGLALTERQGRRVALTTNRPTCTCVGQVWRC